MALTRGTATANASTTVTKPTVSIGDLLLVSVHCYGTTPGTMAISGFTQVVQSTTGNNGGFDLTTVAILRRIIDGSEGSTFTITGGGGTMGNHAVPYSGADTTTPTTDPKSASGTGGTSTLATITPTVDNGQFFVVNAAFAGSIGTPSGFTLGADDGIAEWDYKTYTTATASGSVTWSNGSGGSWACAGVAVNPAATSSYAAQPYNGFIGASL